MFLNKVSITKLSSLRIINILSSRFKHVNISYSITDANISKTDSATISSPKPSMLVLHGFFGNKKNFQSFANGFSKQTGIQVVTVDVRNHGQSGHGQEMDYMTLAEDMIHLISHELLLSNSIVLGHSMGGKIAMAMALKSPELVKALVVVDIAPGNSEKDEFKFYTKLIRRKMDMDFTGLSLSEARKRASEGLSDLVENKWIIDFFLTNLIISQDRSVKWRINLPSMLENYHNIMNFPPFKGIQYDKPTLFIGGANSDYIKKEDEGAIKGYFPQASVTMLPNAGHWVHADEPVSFMNTVVQFIRSINPTNQA